MMYREIEIERIRDTAAELGLEANDRFWIAPAARLAQACNGYGPERWPEWARNAMTWIFRNYAASAAIHDDDYEHSDGTEYGRKLADGRFGRNLRREWAARYGAARWIRPAALIGRAKIRLAYRAVRRGGRQAWLDACERNCRREAVAHG